MPDDEGRDVIEQFLGTLWEKVDTVDEGGHEAAVLVALPKTG
jgi:hypothetical protein